MSDLVIPPQSAPEVVVVQTAAGAVEVTLPVVLGDHDVWGPKLNAAMKALAAASGGGGGTPSVVVLTRNADGSWPAVPTPAPAHVQWWDLTGLPQSDPPGYRSGKDLIYDSGAV